MRCEEETLSGEEVLFMLTVNIFARYFVFLTKLYKYLKHRLSHFSLLLLLVTTAAPVQQETLVPVTHTCSFQQRNKLGTLYGKTDAPQSNTGFSLWYIQEIRAEHFRNKIVHVHLQRGSNRMPASSWRCASLLSTKETYVSPHHLPAISSFWFGYRIIKKRISLYIIFIHTWITFFFGI